MLRGKGLISDCILYICIPIRYSAIPPPYAIASTTNSTTTTPPPHLTKQDLTELKCHAVDDGAPRLPKDPEYTARVLETAQYEWNTTNGCKKYAFDRIAFAKRCLRAKAGVT
jgi:hypothetical protein